MNMGDSALLYVRFKISLHVIQNTRLEACLPFCFLNGSFLNLVAVFIKDTAKSIYCNTTIQAKKLNANTSLPSITICFSCWSDSIGRNGRGKQHINLDTGCWRHGTIIHEIGETCNNVRSLLYR